MNRFVTCFKKLREIVWPLLDKKEASKSEKISLEDCKWHDKDNETVSTYIKNSYDQEEKRRNDVESKSSIYIGTFGVATTVLLSLAKDMVFNSSVQHNALRLIMVVVLTFAIVYLCRAIWFAIKALERKKYCVIEVPKYLLSDEGDKNRRLIADQYNCIKFNEIQTNLKVDSMVMAQEYFKRAIAIVVLFSLISLISYIFSYNDLIKKVTDYFNSIDISRTLFVILIAIFVIFTGLLVKSHCTIQRLKKAVKNSR